MRGADVDEIEVAWVDQFRRLTKLVAWSAAILYVAYGVVDWLAQPGALSRTWYLRLVGASTCLAGVLLIDRPQWRRWMPWYVAATGAIASTVVSVIYLGVLNQVLLAVAAHLQVLMALAVVAAVRTAVRASLAAMLLSMNLLLLLQGAGWQEVALANWMIAGAALLLLVLSERAYQTYAYARDLELRLMREATIVQSSGDAIIGLALDGTVTTWNAGAQALFGYSSQEMAGQPVSRLVPAGSQDEERRILERIKVGESVSQFDTRRVVRDGSLVDVSVVVSPLRGTGGDVQGASVIARDISQRVRAERALLEQESQFHVAIEASTDGFWATDLDGRLLEVNGAYVRQSGYSRQELIGMGIAELDAVDASQDVSSRIAQVMRVGSLRFETLHRRKDGSVWPADVVTTYAAVRGGRFFVFIKDLTEQRRAQELIWHQANFDKLTDLPNRALLYDRLSHACSQARRNNHHVALLFADLDGFKQVNDRYGHEAGDTVLVTVARRWQALVREADTVARIGGDEFAIVLDDLTDVATAAEIAQKLLDSLVPEVPLGRGRVCQIGASIGIAAFPDNGTEIDSLYLAADAAMYDSKARHKNTWTRSLAVPSSVGGDGKDWMVFRSVDCVGVDSIDGQHRGLVALINQLNRAVPARHADREVKALLDQLLLAAVLHFDFEHALMREHEYPERDRHEREHQQLLGEVRQMAQRFADGADLLVLQTVKDWLLGHMHGMDRRLGEFLSGRGVR